MAHSVLALTFPIDSFPTPICLKYPFQPMEDLKATKTRTLSTEEHIGEDDKNSEYSLPAEKGFLGPALYLYQGFWCPSTALRDVINFRDHFQAQDTDIIIATKPKSGTTWLKALTFAIVTRQKHQVMKSSNDHPLLSSNPHQLVPFLEFHIYANGQTPGLTDVLSPRLFGTHIPYASLPESVKSSKCRIVYMWRNPIDTLVSFWTYATRKKPDLLHESSIEEYTDSFCRGAEGFGPYWDHVLGYWNASLENPGKILFMRYEDMKEDSISQIKRLAEFLGHPFSLEEEKEGVVEGIANLCSIDTLKDLKVNKGGKYMPHIENELFFRKGEVGGWADYLTPIMADHLRKIMKVKFAGSSLSF